MGAPPDIAVTIPAPEPLLSEAVPATSAPPQPVPWVKIAWFAGLLILCYFPVLQRLVWQWSNDDDMSHGFFVPLVAGYIVWWNRAKLQSLDWRGSNAGAVLLVWAAFQLMIGTLGAELFLQRTAVVESIVGVVLFLGGWQVLKEMAFPLFLLVFMVPIPSVIYNQITFPLQIFASTVAEKALGAIGVPVLREGNVLELASQKLSVVEACSGIRSLLTLSFMSLVYGFFFDTRPWMKWVLLVATIPIAIIANATRVTITGIISEIDAEFANGFFHILEGWVIFMVALAMLFAFHRFMNWLVGRFGGEKAHA